MVLWLAPKQRLYGLNADKSFVEDDPKAEYFTVDETLQVDVRLSSDAVAASQSSLFKNEKQTTTGLYTLRFNPDGFHSHATPLHQAALANHASVVRLLVERSARLDIRDTIYQGTPLDWAVYAGHTALADYLRQHAARLACACTQG